MRSLLLLFVASSLLPGVGFAQQEFTEHTLKLDEGETPAPASIEDLAWMAGNWKGEGFGGTVEEAWAPALGGTMMGMFRLVRDDQVDFYELMLIQPQEESLVLRVKHFSREFTAWEKKEESLDFRLVRLGEKKAFFHGLTIHRVDRETLHTYLVMRSREGQVSEKLLSFKRY